jgi:hypothetical protein
MFEGAAFDCLSEFLDDVQFIIHSSRSGQARDRARLDRRSEAWHQAYPPMALNPELPDSDALSRKILAFGFSENEARDLERLCRDASLNLDIVVGDAGEASTYDAVIVGGGEEVTYGEIVTFLSQGRPLIGPATDGMREIPDQHLAVESTGAASSPSLSDYVPVIARFYEDPECRRRLARGIQSLFGERHSNQVYRARIAEILREDQTA